MLKSRAGQFGHSVADGLPLLQHFKGAVLPGRRDAEMGPANSLHTSAYYSKFNERFDLIIANLKRAIVMIMLIFD